MTKRSAGRKARKAEFAAKRAERRADRPLVAVRISGRGTVTDFGEPDPADGDLPYPPAPYDIGPVEAESGVWKTDGSPSQEVTDMLDRDLERSRLNVKSITELRKLSKGGVVEGGYSMKKAELVEALLDAGVRG